MKPEVSCYNTSSLVAHIRKTKGQEGIDQLLYGIEEIDEQFLYDPDNWISLRMLLKLFANTQGIYGDPSPRLFYHLGQEVSATQRGALVTLAKWLGNPGSVIRSSPSFNRRFNVDQEMEIVSTGQDSALVINYFLSRFYKEERKDQCEWTKGILAGIPLLWGQPPAEIAEAICSFGLEDILTREYTFLGLHVEARDGIVYVNGMEHAHRIGLTQSDCGKRLFRNVRETPPGITRGTSEVISGEFHHDRHVGFSAHLVTKTLNVDGHQVIREGEIYGAPYCLYDIKWNRLPFWKNLYNRTVGRYRLFHESNEELERLLVLSEQRLFEAEEAREELAELNRVLRLRAKELAGQLIEAEKLAAVGRLSFGIGHDLRNTLATAINSGIPLSRLVADLQHVMGMLEQEKPAEEIAGYMSQRRIHLRLGNAPDLYRTMMSSLAQALDNVKALEGYAVQDGSDFQEMRIEDVIERVLADHRDELDRIRVETSFAEQEYAFQGNPLKIYDIFQNLVLNAIEAMEDTANPVLRIVTEVHESVHQTVVEDNGCGMSQEVIKHAFEPFYTTRELADGRQRGLGLFNVWRLVEQHSGTIEAESEPGRSTRLVVKFAVRDHGGRG